MRLQDETVVVTGASSGLGRATALLAAEEGAKVVNADLRREPRYDERPTDEVIEEAGGEAIFVETDVTDLAAVEATMDAATDAFGSLDAVVNNGTLAAVERMLEGDGGSIVNMASVFGVVGEPNSASYSAAKGGVISLTRQVARDYAREGIRVNSVSPGFIDTPMLRQDTHDGTVEFAEKYTPMGRVGQPAEIAEAVVYLAGDTASFVTGQNLVVDGGFGMT